MSLSEDKTSIALVVKIGHTRQAQDKERFGAVDTRFACLWLHRDQVANSDVENCGPAGSSLPV